MVTKTAKEARADAKAAGLVYSTDVTPGITRVRRGKGWSFRDPDGAVLPDGPDRQRCLALAIPPAYEDVWICPDRNGHLQATGRDAKGRKVYIYHEDWRAFRDEKKFRALASFGRKLGKARQQNDAARRGLAPTQGRILAAVFWLLDEHVIRIGNESYAKENRSFGATTLRQRHVKDDGTLLRFRGKHGREQDISLSDRRFKGLVRKLSDLPGQHLFQYRDETGDLCALTSGEVNAYLHGLFGEPITAKTFRTWHGSVEAFAAGLAEGALVDDVLGAAAGTLGNTKAIARNSYVHPRIIDEVKSGALAQSASGLRGGRRRAGLSSEETWFLRWLGDG
ncbi:DNA topoisomerase IB [Parvularcula lutaonensis]|uniref:DNA topoisomerase n=1 Tax=Parvularcula lutaonensis TaxID=491923 RepID=A0ABV7MCD6_9PROT|nr:DNA topoisomerase IB [Parvularcula lutaonensis]GGY50337.1 DNA topoisomerase [Parvularcula lutaonensis]